MPLIAGIASYKIERQAQGKIKRKQNIYSMATEKATLEPATKYLSVTDTLTAPRLKIDGWFQYFKSFPAMQKSINHKSICPIVTITFNENIVTNIYLEIFSLFSIHLYICHL